MNLFDGIRIRYFSISGIFYACDCDKINKLDKKIKKTLAEYTEESRLSEPAPILKDLDKVKGEDFYDLAEAHKHDIGGLKERVEYINTQFSKFSDLCKEYFEGRNGSWEGQRGNSDNLDLFKREFNVLYPRNSHYSSHDTNTKRPFEEVEVVGDSSSHRDDKRTKIDYVLNKENGESSTCSVNRQKSLWEVVTGNTDSGKNSKVDWNEVANKGFRQNTKDFNPVAHSMLEEKDEWSLWSMLCYDEEFVVYIRVISPKGGFNSTYSEIWII